MRNGLEYEVVTIACGARPPDDDAALRSILDDMRTAFQNRDEDRFLRTNWSLHRRIVQLVPDSMLRSLYVGHTVAQGVVANSKY